MGNFLGTRKKREIFQENANVQPGPSGRKPDTGLPSSEKDTIIEDKIALERMRNALKKDLETFVLNNLLMCVQFFENFDRDMRVVWDSTLTDMETDCNRRLAKHERKCLFPDKLHDLVGQRVRFRPRHGSQKHCSQTLTNQRLYIIHQNIELCESLEDTHYSSVDGPNYYFANEATNSAGYVKLRGDENAITKRRNTYETIDETNKDKIYTEPDETPVQSQTPTIYGDAESTHVENGSETGTFKTETEQATSERTKLFRPRSDPSMQYLQTVEIAEEDEISTSKKLNPPVKNSKHIKQRKKLKLAGDDTEKRGSDSSGYKSSSTLSNPGSSFPNSRSSDSDYGYTTIRSLTTPRSLHDFRLGRIPANSSEIPYECFKYITERAIGKKNIKKKKELFERKCYLNSDAYMCNFIDLFVDRFAQALGFHAEIVDMAKKSGAKIYCDIYQSLQSNISHASKTRHEIIPAIQCEKWPKQAEEWVERYRDPKLKLDDNEKPMYYRWPTKKMVKKIKNMGYYLIPMGHLARRGDDKNRIIEWQIVFPEAEKHLEKCLGHPHIRCYLFTMAIYKSFLEPLDAELGLLPSHIRTLLFWQCEKNYIAWPEDRQGETFRKFLERIYEALQHRELQDYFIRDQNLIESMPEAFIYAVQEKLYRINENLVMNMIIALRNIEYTDEKSFYPVLDYKKLYEILTTENPVLLANPDLARGTHNFRDESITMIVHEPDEPTINYWENIETEDPNMEFSEQATRQLAAEDAATKLTAELQQRRSVESIDVKIHIKKGADPLRKSLLLKFFIPHFIEMAKRSNKFRATEQAKMYLKHAERLCILLKEEGIEEVAAREFLYSIKDLQEAARNTPVRQETFRHAPGRPGIARRGPEVIETVKNSPGGSRQEERRRPMIPTPADDKRPQSPPLLIRGRYPLPNDTVHHPDIGEQWVTRVDVHREPQTSDAILKTKIDIPLERNMEDSDEETSL